MAKKNMDLPMGTYEQNEESIVAELRKLMPTKDRDLLDLYLQGFTLDEIAMVLGKTPTAIRKQKTRIIEKMKNINYRIYMLNMVTLMQYMILIVIKLVAQCQINSKR